MSDGTNFEDSEPLLNPDDPDEKSLRDDLINAAYPKWLRPTQELLKFQNYVLTKHAVLENLLNLFITSYFMGSMSHTKATELSDNVLSELDFAKKLIFAERVCGLSEDIKSAAFETNNFRKAQAHMKINDPLRDPNDQNFKRFQQVSGKAIAGLISALTLSDEDYKKRAQKIVEKFKTDKHKDDITR